jgi:hypothetical protein
VSCAPLPTASQLDLAEACLYPWTSGLEWSRAWGEADANDGTAVHAAAAALGRDEPVQLAGLSDSVVESILRVAEVLEGDMLEGTVVLAVEVGFAFDSRTGGVRFSDPDEPRDPELLYGHADVVLRRRDGTLVLRDWKTGSRALRKRVESSRQVAFYALCAAALWGASRVVVELAHVGMSRTWIDRGELDALDLGAMRGWLRALPERIEEARALPMYGRHCRDLYCPVAGSCPASRAFAGRVAAEVELPMPEAHEIASDAMAADVLSRVAIAEAYLGALKLAAEDYVRRRGVVEGKDGSRWGVVEHDGDESLTLTESAEAVLVANGLGAAVQVKRTCSKASVTRAAREGLEKKNGKAEGLSARVNPVLDSLRKHGALKRGSPYSLVEPLPE